MNSTIKNQKNGKQKLLPRGLTRILKFKFLFILLLLGFLTPDLIAQTLDGNPSEWPTILNNAANTKKGFKHDPFNQNGIDNQWTGGSSDKDASPAANWHWVLGNSNDKGDIGNAGAVQLGTKLWFFGDRSSFSGDAQIGFWFFKNNVTPTGTGDRSSPFIGEHSNGDLLIISNFTNGGGHAEPAVYQWQGKTASAPGAPVLITNADADLTTNSSTFPVPDDAIAPHPGFLMYNGETWSFAAKASPNSATYPAPLFFEGWVDLATISSSPCFQAFLLETRNSASINASLQDFVAGSFTGTIPVTANAGYSAGASDPGPVSLASVPPHYYLSTTVNGVLNDPNFSYSWAQDPTTGGSLSAANIANPTFTATTAGSFTWTVTATGQGCVASSPVTRVIAAPATCPTFSTTPVCAGGTTSVSITTGEAGNAIPAFTHYEWSIVAPANGAIITSADVTDVTSVNITAGTANFTVKVRVTYDNTNLAARENCTAVVTVKPNPVGSASPQRICSGSTSSVALNSSLANTTFTWTAAIQTAPTGGTISGQAACSTACGTSIAQTLTNTGTSAGVVRYTVTPVADGCTGATFTVDVTVNPIPVLAQPDNQTVCKGTSTTLVTFSAPGATSITWTNNNTAIGLGASGTGNIAAFTGTNAGTTPISGTITATPHFLEGGVNCDGVAKTFTITVNPDATAPDVTYIPPTCTQSTFKVQVTNPQEGSTYTLKQLNGNTFNIGPYASGDLIFEGLTVGQGYSVQATANGGCKSGFNDCGTFTHTTNRVSSTANQVEQVSQEATVIAAPNPFNDKIRFSIKSPLSGKGSLELYNMLGQKVKTVFEGNIEKGMIQSFEYNVPGAQRANMIYVFRVGNQKVSGKLIGLK